MLATPKPLIIPFAAATLHFLAHDRVVLTFRPGRSNTPLPGAHVIYQAPSARFRLLVVSVAKSGWGFAPRRICVVLQANRCPTCNGSEAIPAPGTTCPECGGSGKKGKDPCPDCEGLGTIDFAECPACGVGAGGKTG